MARVNIEILGISEGKWTAMGEFNSGHLYVYYCGQESLRRIHLPMQETQLDPWVGKIPLEKEMAPHSSILAWEIPWTEEPGGLQSVGSQRAGHD